MKKNGFGWSRHPPAFDDWQKQTEPPEPSRDYPEGYDEIPMATFGDIVEELSDRINILTGKMVNLAVSIFIILVAIIFIFMVGKYLMTALNEELTPLTEQAVIFGINLGTCFVVGIGLVVLYFILSGFLSFSRKKTY